jgi:hypothetical protein
MMARRDVRVTPVGGHSSLSLDFPPCGKAKRNAARRRLWIQIKLEIVDQAAINAWLDNPGAERRGYHD